MKQLNYIISYFFQLHLMLHACVRRFDVTGTVGNFLGTKQGLRKKLCKSYFFSKKTEMLHWSLIIISISILIIFCHVHQNHNNQGIESNSTEKMMDEGYLTFYILLPTKPNIVPTRNVRHDFD